VRKMVVIHNELRKFAQRFQACWYSMQVIAVDVQFLQVNEVGEGIGEVR
jgi:hypothetical protein